MPKVTKKITAKTTTKKSLSPDTMRNLIEKKAYELFEKRGYGHGNDWNDWLKAERIIKSGKL